MHSPEQMRKKEEARAEAMHHHQNSNVMETGEDHPGDDFYRSGERMNQESEDKEKTMKGNTRYQAENAPRWGGRRFGGSEQDVERHKKGYE